MAATYEQLLADTAPAVIEDEVRYEAMNTRFGNLVAKGHGRTADETRLMRLLGLLIRDSDVRQGLAPDEPTPAERLRYLMEQTGKKPAELVGIFSQRSHVTEALSGKRPISAAQARKLGAMFHLKAGYFVLRRGRKAKGTI